mmetsp:Transcript_93514/g.243578  ORF Transcript_93514/g.243578 Transcript_93514/m.243578 type:complete len:274 (-) Transcript_93514:500-1321(-)
MFLIQRSSQKLRVVNLTTLVAIDILHYLLQVGRDLLQAALPHALGELLHAQHAVTVCVHGLKLLPQRLDLVLAEQGGYHVERRFLQLVHRPELPQVVHQSAAQVHLRGSGRRELDPDVLQGVLGCAPLRLVSLEHAVDKMYGICRNVVPDVALPVELELALPDLLENLVVRVAIERRLPREQHVHDNSRAPHIAHLVVPSHEHLWGDVVRRPRLGGQRDLFVELAAQAEVDQLQVALLDRRLVLEEQIFRLQVTVCDAPRVHVVEAAQKLLHD